MTFIYRQPLLECVTAWLFTPKTAEKSSSTVLLKSDYSLNSWVQIPASPLKTRTRWRRKNSQENIFFLRTLWKQKSFLTPLTNTKFKMVHFWVVAGYECITYTFSTVSTKNKQQALLPKIKHCNINKVHHRLWLFHLKLLNAFNYVHQDRFKMFLAYC